MRKEFELTDAEVEQLKVPSHVPYMIFGGHAPRSPQEMANDNWRLLGHKRGFVWDTVEPSPKGENWITAEEMLGEQSTCEVG